jgi:cell wall-associated NlpC family hydrolase
MPVPIWAGRYIGLPFMERGRDRGGLDCWGLVRLIMAEQFMIALPCFAREYDRTADSDVIGGIVRREAPQWRAIPAGEEELGDVIVLRMRGAPMHVGTVIGDGQMLHIEKGVNSAIDRYQGLRWRDRIEGFYRYRTYLDDLEYEDHDDA